jgi:cellobiose phosphorylase
MYRIAIEDVLGLKRVGDSLQLSPCIPPSWTEFQVTYHYGKSELALEFENPNGVPTGIRRIELDGRELPGATIALVDDGRRHRARVVMGQAGVGAERVRDPWSASQARSAE